MAEASHRFSRLRRAEPIPGGHVVCDANGQGLAHVYSRGNEAGARQAKVLMADEARRIAINIARLLGLAQRVPDNALSKRQGRVRSP
jgi:hypothetical protein